MRKIAALYINEMLKISKKISVLVMLGIMILGVIGFCGLIKRQEKSFGYINPEVTDDTWIYSEMQNIVAMNQEQLKTLEAQIKNASESDKPDLVARKASIMDQIALYQLAIDKKIPLLNSNDYRALALQNVISLKSALRSLQQIGDANRTKEENAAMIKNTELISRYEKLVDQQNFREYLNIKNDEIKADVSLSDGEKQISLASNELWYKVDPTGGVSGNNQYANIQSSLNDVTNLRKSLLNNVDYGNNTSVRPLTPARRAEVENELAVLVYRLENGLGTDAYNLVPEEIAIRGMFGFGNFVIVILMMILAGGAVSQEIATGSIKSLIISPTRRWKIFAAKALSLLSVGLVVSFVLYIVAMMANGAFFGFNSGAAYVYAAHGVAGELNAYVFKLGSLLVSFIDVIVYMTLAFMLSIVTRNTAAAVGISIAVYFGGNIANSFISLFAKGDWLKFIPFNNLGLASDFFPFDTFAASTGGFFGAGTGGAVNPSIQFSLIYLAVLVICMGYTALDSFSRRDIK